MASNYIIILKNNNSFPIYLFQTTTSVTHNWSLEVNKNNTPSKRMSPPKPTLDPDAAEFSTPKASTTKSARTKAARQTKNKAS